MEVPDHLFRCSDPIDDLIGGTMEHETVEVYVPTVQACATTLTSLVRGAGIVGSPEHGHLRIDYATDWPRPFTGPSTWADRVEHAAELHLDRSATATRSWVPDDDLVVVGEFDGEAIIPHPWRVADIHRWVTDFSPRQLEVTRSEA
jgi:hypothetical protein